MSSRTFTLIALSLLLGLGARPVRARNWTAALWNAERESLGVDLYGARAGALSGERGRGPGVRSIQVELGASARPVEGAWPERSFVSGVREREGDGSPRCVLALSGCGRLATGGISGARGASAAKSDPETRGSAGTRR